MVVKHIIDIDFVARNNTPVVHLVQYDDGLPLLVVRTFQNGAPLALSSDELTASLRFMKQDGNFVLSPGAVTEKEISFKIPSSMTVFQGKYPGKVELKDVAGQIVCSATIVFDIDRNPVQKDAVESDSDYKDYVDQVLGQIPSIDAYSKNEADSKFASKDDLQTVDTDIQDLKNNKLDKVTTSGSKRVYVIDSSGNQGVRPYTGNGYGASTLLFRESNGDCKMQDPISPYSIANKRYVDSSMNIEIVSIETPGDGGQYDLDCGGRRRYVYNGQDQDCDINLVNVSESTDIDLYIKSRNGGYQDGRVTLSYGDTFYPINFYSVDEIMDEYNENALQSEGSILLYFKITGTDTSSVVIYCEKSWGNVSGISQETGESTTLVMSQYAVTESLANVTSAAEEASAELVSSLLNQSTVHVTNVIGSSEVALQSGKRYFIEGTDASQSPQVTMSLNNVTAKTNIEVFCKFAHNVILAFEHPNTTIETYGTGDLEQKITALNSASKSGTGYLHLRIVGLQANQCAVLISN